MTQSVQIVPGSAPAGSITTATLTGADSAPSGGGAGVSVAGYSQLAVSVHTFTEVSAWTVELWVYDGAGWAQALDADGAAISYSGTTGTGAQVFNVAGFERAFARLSALTGTSLVRTHRPCGPGL